MLTIYIVYLHRLTINNNVGTIQEARNKSIGGLKSTRGLASAGGLLLQVHIQEFLLVIIK